MGNAFEKSLQTSTQPIIHIIGNIGDIYTEKELPINKYLVELLKERFDAANIDYFDAANAFLSELNSEECDDPQVKYRSRDESCCSLKSLRSAFQERDRCIIVDLSCVECGCNSRKKFLTQLPRLVNYIGEGVLLIIGDLSDYDFLKNVESGLDKIEIIKPTTEEIKQYCSSKLESICGERINKIVPYLHGMYLRQIVDMGRDIVAACKSDEACCDLINRLKKSSEGNNSSISFSDVVGLENAKHEIYCNSILPNTLSEKYKHEYDRLQLDGDGGMLLLGPPGTGKTLLGRATATELGATFQYVQLSEVLSMWFGESERKIHELFAAARAEENRSVIFLDEIDAIAQSRGGSEAMNRVTTQFLTEMNDSSDKIFIIGATNRPQIVDSALMRHGRLGNKIYVPLPDKANRRKIVEINLRGLDCDFDIDLIVEKTRGFNGSDIAALCKKAKRDAFFRYCNSGGNRMTVVQQDFDLALKMVRSTVNPGDIAFFKDWCAKNEVDFTDSD